MELDSSRSALMLSLRHQVHCESSLSLSLARLLFAGDGEEGNRAVCRSLKRRSPAPVASSWADTNVGEP